MAKLTVTLDVISHLLNKIYSVHKQKFTKLLKNFSFNNLDLFFLGHHVHDAPELAKLCNFEGERISQVLSTGTSIVQAYMSLGSSAWTCWIDDAYNSLPDNYYWSNLFLTPDPVYNRRFWKREEEAFWAYKRSFRRTNIIAYWEWWSLTHSSIPEVCVSWTV